MRYIHCPYNVRLRCYEHNERACPFKAREFIGAVQRWALKSGDLRSMDPGVAIGSLSKYRTNTGQECRALEAALMYRLFDNPDAVLGWLQSGSVRRAAIPKSVCDDLKQAGRKWKEAQKAEKAKTTTGSALEYSIDARTGTAYSI